MMSNKNRGKFAKKKNSLSNDTIVQLINICPTIVKRVERINCDFSEFTKEALEHYLNKCEFEQNIE